ncbi:SURF1 family protein [Microbacterium sp. DT81.1]|uniref:SURF1 family cytochrome oxidase biogenesis protein n=1 Tax=Microbacterium sp. DT81.1 TaxID=3393413 RepID=UPI003CFA0B02
MREAEVAQAPRRSDTRRSAALRWSGYVALALAFAVGCWFLSQWQFARNEQRAAQLDLVAENYDADPVPIGEVLTGLVDFDSGDEWLPVLLTGEYVVEDQLLARNRPRGGTSAFEVLTPLRLDDGRIFIVDRGWVPPGEGTVPDEIPAPPTGEVTVIARLRPGEALPSRSAPEGQVPTIHLASIAEVSGASTITSAYGLMISEDPAPATRPNALDAPTEDPGPHLSYAIQWILFALMGFIFIGYIIRTEIKVRREDAEDAAAEAELPEDAPKPPRRPRTPTRRRDRDMSEEDAILDSAGR